MTPTLPDTTPGAAARGTASGACPTPTRMALRKELAARLKDPAREIPAETLDGPGPRLIIEGRFGAAPNHELDATLVIAPLYQPSRTLAVHLVAPGGVDIFPTSDRLNGRLLLSIRTLLAETFDNPAIMAPIFARVQNTALDSVHSGFAEDGSPETRVLMRAGALLWSDLCEVTSHQRLSIPRRTHVREYRILMDAS